MYLNLKRHIQIETNTLEYTIGGVPSQMTLDQNSFNHITYENHSDSAKSKIGRLLPLVFFSQKIISTEICYKTHYPKLLAILDIFKTWCHFLDG